MILNLHRNLLMTGALLCALPTTGLAQEPGAEGEDGPPEVLVTIPQVEAPIQGEPGEFIPSGGFEGVLLSSGVRVLDLDSGAVFFEPKDKDEAIVTRAIQCRVGKAPYLGCGLVGAEVKTRTFKVTERVSERTVEVEKTVTWERHRLGFGDNLGNFVELATQEDSVPSVDDPSVGTRYSFDVLGLFVDLDDTPHLFYTLTRTVTSRGKGNALVSESTSETLLWEGKSPRPFAFGGGQPITAVRRDSGSGVGHPTRTNPLLQFARVKGRLCMVYATETGAGPLVMECLGEGQAQEPPRELHQGVAAFTPTSDASTVVTVVEEAMYDFRFRQGPDGWLYLFYHDPSEESAMVALSQDGQTWTPQIIDEKESGWQLDAAVGNGKVFALYYYFRNSFNKGLRVVAFEGGKIVQGPSTIVRQAEHNTGWYPFLGVSSSGSVWMTYWDNVLEESRAWARVNSVKDLSQHAIKETGRWEDSYKNWYLQAGVGGWFAAWQLFDITPDPADTDQVAIGESRYTLASTLLSTVAFEAELFGASLGLSYARSIIKDAQGALKEQVDDDAVDFFSGQLKIDKIFPGHDVKVQFTTGRYQGFAEPGDNVIFEQGQGGGGFLGATGLPIDTQYVDAQALFLNKWRLKYGLALTSYTLPMTLHTWHAPQDQAAYQFTGSFFRQTDNTSIKALFGYSTLDYVSKYENRYNGLILDLYVDGGLSLLSFDTIALPGVEEPVDDALTLDLRLSLNVGWLFFKRWYNTLGFGFYIQPAYMVEGSLTGLPARPGDRDLSKEDADTGPDSTASPGFTTLRHGPRLDIGLVW